MNSTPALNNWLRIEDTFNKVDVLTDKETLEIQARAAGLLTSNPHSDMMMLNVSAFSFLHDRIYARGARNISRWACVGREYDPERRWNHHYD